MRRRAVAPSEAGSCASFQGPDALPQPGQQGPVLSRPGRGTRSGKGARGPAPARGRRPGHGRPGSPLPCIPSPARPRRRCRRRRRERRSTPRGKLLVHGHHQGAADDQGRRRIARRVSRALRLSLSLSRTHGLVRPGDRRAARTGAMAPGARNADPPAVGNDVSGAAPPARTEIPFPARTKGSLRIATALPARTRRSTGRSACWDTLTHLHGEATCALDAVGKGYDRGLHPPADLLSQRAAGGSAPRRWRQWGRDAPVEWLGSGDPAGRVRDGWPPAGRGCRDGLDRGTPTPPVQIRRSLPGISPAPAAIARTTPRSWVMKR